MKVETDGDWIRVVKNKNKTNKKREKMSPPKGANSTHEKLGDQGS